MQRALTISLRRPFNTECILRRGQTPYQSRVKIAAIDRPFGSRRLVVLTTKVSYYGSGRYREVLDRFTHIDAELVDVQFSWPLKNATYTVRFYPWWEHP